MVRFLFFTGNYCIFILENIRHMSMESEIESLRLQLNQIKTAAKALVENVENYTIQRCTRSMLLNTKDKLKLIL